MDVAFNLPTIRQIHLEKRSNHNSQVVRFSILEKQFLASGCRWSNEDALRADGRLGSSRYEDS